MYKQKKIAVTIPAYNERKLIRKTIESIPRYIDKIIVVDDASTDDTFLILKNIKKDIGKRLIIIRHHNNQGVGGAIITGYKQALIENMDIAVVMAGDAQMDPNDLPNILDPIVNGKADYSKGNRLLNKNIRDIMPGIRYFGNSLLTILTKIATGYWGIMDPECGYTAISKKTLGILPLDKIYRRYGFENDILIQLNIYRQRVINTPVIPVYAKEKSGIMLYSFIPKISFLLLRGFLHRMKEKYLIREFHPLLLFYFYGFIATLIGIILALQISYLRIFRHIIATDGTIILTALLLITGLQAVFFAMWFDMEDNKKLGQ